MMACARGPRSHANAGCRRPAFALSLALGLMPPVSAVAAEGALSCQFVLGASWSYSQGSYRNVAPEPLAFDVTAIDLTAQTAQLSVDGKPNGAALRVVRALNANHFLEVAAEGFLNVTTIYDVDPATGQRPAIHSRHLGVLGQPVFAQYAGFCRDKG